jgi:hypothetical protein
MRAARARPGAVVEPRRLIPVVCDLTDAPDSPEARVAEYRELFAAHLVGCSTVDGVVRFRFRADEGVEDRVRDLVTREQHCCGFFEFSVSVDDGEVLVVASVGEDDAARAMLDEWSRLPETVAGGVEAVRERWTAGGITFVEGPTLSGL